LELIYSMKWIDAEFNLGLTYYLTLNNNVNNYVLHVQLACAVSYVNLLYKGSRYCYKYRQSIWDSYG